MDGILNKSLSTVCVSLCVSVLTLLGKHVAAATNTRNNPLIVIHYVACTAFGGMQAEVQ
jgi:hypothetical protein